ncbi:restriction endonuclease subunit S [Acidovorax carolinensis]|uniref:restriction endonuclease subunit S n=1 Tax=Acidovorax carolinensis TaxID=553814 RepID=UPI001F28CB68|nr:restriction endonuclease subunit S [Acidovorax carolinensis]
MSISAGIGFVPQAEKFGRDISGNQYQLYTLVKDGDFVYNKGNSLKFPEGCIYLLQDWGQVAAPNVFICFRLKYGYSNGFFQNCFEANFHGKQLKRHITSGARSNGLLNISKDAFFGVQIPTPTLQEQQEIADCLSSLDELIAAQVRKVDALKTHKKGLMQQLFPREGETQPRLRFPEFRGAGDWVPTTIGAIGSFYYGKSAPKWSLEESAATPCVRYGELYTKFGAVITETYSKTNIDPKNLRFSKGGEILVPRVGEKPEDFGKNCSYLPIKNIAIGEMISVFETKQNPLFFTHYFRNMYRQFAAVVEGQNVKNLYYTELEPLAISHPILDEQQRIADCLTSLDTLITAATQELETLKIHKKGLMQQLFPSAQAVEV